MNTSARHLGGWRLKAVIVSMVIATLGYLAFSLWGGWQEVVDAMMRIGIIGTAVALALSLVNYGLRFLRWQQYLGHLGYAVHWLPSLRIYLAGFALTTTPGKAGEAFRGFLLKGHGVPFPTTFAAFVSERLSDLVAIVLLTLFGLAQYPQARGIVLTGVAGITLVLVVISSQRILQGLQELLLGRLSGKMAEAIDHVFRVILDTRRCHTPGMVAGATLLSFVSWGAEALAFYLVLDLLGADVSLAFAVFVYALSMLAGALSFMPGGLGGAEAVMVSLLVLKGMSMPEAVAATVFIRLATLWFAVILGIIALYQSRHGESL